MLKESFVTVQEAAKMMGTTREKVGRLIKDGTLPVQSSKLDARRKLIPLQAVEQLIDQEGHGSAPKTRADVGQFVWDEMHCIPADTPIQELFRITYGHFRSSDLSRDPNVSPRIAIKQATKAIRLVRPAFRPRYDKRLLNVGPLEPAGSERTPNRD